MRIKYRINGSNLFRDNSPGITFHKGMKVIINSKTYEIDELTLDYHCEDPAEGIELIADLKNPEQKELAESKNRKFTKCIHVWDRSKHHLTLDKVYEIIRDNDRTFTIIDDKGNQRDFTYSRNNTQFQFI